MAAHVTLPPRFGRYRIIKPLGAGGMGAVYLAEDTVLSRMVAIKVPHFTADDGPLVRERFLREARAAAAIDHPCLCPIYDTGECEGIQYLSMPFIEGQALSHLVDEENPWPPEQALTLVKKLAGALQVLHDRGLIHRDLKPSNVMVRANGEPVIMDFGLAKSLANQGRQLTKLGSMVGTLSFMPPEQVLGDLKLLGPASDVYSLGVLFYELLTGQLPFEGPPAAVIAQILHANPEAPSARRPGLGSWLDAVCLKALAKKPEQRYATMTEFARALEAPPPLAATVHATDPGPPLATAWPQTQATQPVPLPNAPAPIVAAVTCPQCRKKLKVPPGVEGKKLFCPRCQANLTHLQAAPRPIPAPAALFEFTVPARSAVKAPLGRWLAAGLVLLICLAAGWTLFGPNGKSKSEPSDKRDTVVKATDKIPPPPEPNKDRKPDPPKDDPPDPNKDKKPDDKPPDPNKDKKPDPIEDKPPNPAGKDFTNSISMKFVRVGKGTFWMGSPASEKDRDENREEQKEVTIKSDFYIGIHEVTQEQWEAVMGVGKNPSYFSHTGGGKDKAKDIPIDELKLFPVEAVSWNDVQQFLEKLNEREKTRNNGWLYRLPKEAEWEYVCRGGPTSSRQEVRKTDPFHFAEPTFSLSSKQANFNGNVPFGDAANGPHLDRPCKVGLYEPNQLGIYDMHGNVWEWCDDVFERDSLRVIRGGSYNCFGSGCRAANRFWYAPSVRSIYLGFRLARVPVK